MKELLIVAGVVLVGYGIYTLCQTKKKEMKTIPDTKSNEPNYTTPPSSAPMNGFADTPDAFLKGAVRQFDARPNSTVSRATTTIKVGINEPNDVQSVVYQ